MFNSNEPVKAVNFQKQANQLILNGPIVISTIIFINARKTLFSRLNQKLSNEKRDMWTIHG